MKKVFIFILLAFTLSGFVYSQHDADSLKNILNVWQINKSLREEVVNYNDSTLEMFHIVRSDEKYSILTSNLGNVGSPNISNEYFKRFDLYKDHFSFNDPYFIYIKNAENVLYYNTRKPYTSIMHTTSTKLNDLQTIDFTHTQNINPNFNFGLNYDFISSRGQFGLEANQQTKINSVGISANYKREKYTAYLAYTFNGFTLQNSGGYGDSISFKDIFPPPRLTGSNTVLKNQDLSFTQVFKIGKFKNLSYQDTIIKVLEPKLSLSHNIILSRKYRIYTDEEVKAQGEEIIYNDFFIQDDLTYDSIGYRSMVNKIMLGSEEVFEKSSNFGFSAGFNSNYYQIFNFKRYFFLENSNVYFENQLFAEIYTIKSKTGINLSSSYYFTGYRTGDYRISVLAKRHIFKNKPNSYISVSAKYTKQKADFFQNRFYSNHFRWENDFAPMQYADVTFIFWLPENRFKIQADARFIKNYTYYSSNKLPLQYNLGLTILSAYLEKNFIFNRFDILNKVIWQYSSEENTISLPQLAAYHSAYLKIRLENALLLHVGYDVTYSGKYKAISYNPAIGQFYFDINSNLITGNYPNFTVFANFKIKRNVLLFFKFSNVNSGILQETMPYNVRYYPIYGRLFKFGVKWTFKN